MKKRFYLLAAVAATAVATPAMARDGQGYFGVDVGALFPKDPSDGVVFIDYTTIDDLPGGPAGPSDVEFGDALGFNAKTGWDADIVAGYDFGMFRLEGELGYKARRLISTAPAKNSLMRSTLGPIGQS